MFLSLKSRWIQNWKANQEAIKHDTHKKKGESKHALKTKPNIHLEVGGISFQTEKQNSETMRGKLDTFEFWSLDRIKESRSLKSWLTDWMHRLEIIPLKCFFFLPSKTYSLLFLSFFFLTFSWLLNELVSTCFSDVPALVTIFFVVVVNNFWTAVGSNLCYTDPEGFKAVWWGNFFF